MNAQRSWLIDLLKAGASQAIVLHHLIAYGALAGVMDAAAPQLLGPMFSYSRMAVQLFLVVSGYLAARQLAPNHRAWPDAPLQAVGQRYVRLVTPYLAALCLAIAVAALVRPLTDDPAVPGAPTWAQGLAHLLLLQNLLGFDALTTGVWYVAIDLQLFALTAALLWLGRRWALPAIGALALAALFHFNRINGLDDWALYFFGAYALGAGAYWLEAQSGAARRTWLLCAGLLVVAALALDFRERLLLAAATALALAAKRPLDSWLARPDHAGLQRLLARLGPISYALFLVHFPVCLLFNALFVQCGLSGVPMALLFMAAAWACSVVLAGLFYRWIEQPTMRLRAGRVGVTRSAA
jgi:peptidoglycan/LPS O-acetylase OafA/YrhL